MSHARERARRESDWFAEAIGDEEIMERMTKATKQFAADSKGDSEKVDTQQLGDDKGDDGSDFNDENEESEEEEEDNEPDAEEDDHSEAA
eukprot:4048968-Pyramimonas_sp.AAC.1